MLPIHPRRQPAGDPRLQGQGEPKPLLAQEHVERFARWIVSKNIAEELSEDERQKIADQAKREYQLDEETRADWKQRYQDWLKFAMQITDQKTYPWPNASNVCYPLITTAALQFNSRAYPAIVQGRNVVKGTVIGDDRGIPLTIPLANALAGGGGGPGGPGAPPGAPGAPQGPPQGPTGAPAQLPAGAPASPGPPMGGGAPPAGAPQLPGPPQQATSPDGRPLWIVPPGAKQARADKIGRHMSWQLLTEMPDWEEQTDRLLIVTSICGTMFRKNYFDPAAGRNVSETVDALRVCVNYRAKSFDVVPRISEEIDVYPWDVQTNVRSGLWLDYGDEGYGKNMDAGQDEQAPITFIEQHRRYDLDGDGYDEPLIVTFARDSGKLARIAVGFDEEGIEAAPDGEVQKITPLRYYTKYPFLPNPESGVYDIGFGNLLYPLNAAVNSSLNQLFDAGHLQIAGGGFIGGGLSINSGAIRFTMGEYKVVNAQGRALRENLVPLQMPGPNMVLVQLLEFLVEAGKEIGSIKDVLTGDIPGANVPGILGLAIIQQGMKVFNAVFKRIHRSLRQDYEKLFRLNRLYLPDNSGFAIGSEYFQISREDYERGAGVEPVSDPEMVTDTQQMAQANFLLQFAQDPFFDGREIRLRAMQAAAVPQIDKLLAAQAPPNADIVTQMAQLDLEKQAVELRSRELDIRAAREQADLAIRRGKDKATEIRDLTQAILNLANAHKADQEVNQDWYELQLTRLRHQIDLLNVISDTGPPGENPAAAGGNGGPAPGDVAGSIHAGISGMAPPPGQPGSAAVPGGLS